MESAKTRDVESAKTRDLESAKTRSAAMLACCTMAALVACACGKAAVGGAADGTQSSDGARYGDGARYTESGVCIPACTDRECGSDRCGGECGRCAAPNTCGGGGIPFRCGGGCATPEAAADVDPWAIKVPGPGFGGMETVRETWRSGGPTFTHVYLKGPEDYIRLGVRREWGGAIQFFGLARQLGTNVVDEGAPDPGRQFQVALWDRSRPIVCGSAGWNPTWAGDECGKGSPVDEIHQEGDAMRVLVHPAQWNPIFDRCSAAKCTGSPRTEPNFTFLSDMRFVSSHAVEVSVEIRNLDETAHTAAAQELPCLYVSYKRGLTALPGENMPTSLTRFYGWNGSSAAQGSWLEVTSWSSNSSGQHATVQTKGAAWVSWQRATLDYGVGLAMDSGFAEFSGWKMDSANYYVRHTRPMLEFEVPANAVVRGRFYLALGNLGTLASVLRDVMKRRPPFGAIDDPAPQSTTRIALGQPIAVSGWVLDTQHIDEVSVELDGVAVTKLPVVKPRADTCASYPGYTGCPDVGFAGTVPSAGLSRCPYVLRVKAIDGDGNSTVLGERLLVVE